MKVKFVERACDFVLGKKSPLCRSNESRPDLGGTYAHPDFSSVIKLMTALITDEALLEKYPMTEVEKQMILHQDLLKTMLGSATGSKQFGQCLANMCKDNVKLSRKVTKVFLRSIEQAHLDTVKGYLKALKPFLRADDSLKRQKLEWVFGVPEVVSRKGYSDSRYKYGLELVDRINDESMSYSSPILYGASDEALIAQIIKCKGRFDVQCISCLKELLSLMRKDSDVAHFVYHLPPQTYQCSRFTDWFRPYLEEQLACPSRASATTNQYFRNKYDLLTKAMAHLDALEPVFAEFERQQMAQMDACLAGGDAFKDLADHWIGAQSTEVIKHFPPQLIVGKQVADEREIFVHDEDPLVRVQIFEVDCEYAYSAPTGLFNLQVPKLEVRTSHYQTQSYEAHKRAQAAEAEKQANADLQTEATEQQDMSQEDRAQTTAAATSTTTETAQENLTADTRDWDESKRQGPVLLRVLLANKSEDKDLKVWYRLSADAAGPNVAVPVSARKTYLLAKNQKVIDTFVKIDPSQAHFFQDPSTIQVELDVTVRNAQGGPQDSG